MVLSGKSDIMRISPKTKARVQRAAEELDYAPNLLVRAVQRGKTGVLAFFSAFRLLEEDDLYMFRLSMGLEKAAGASGYDLLVHCVFDRPTKEMYQFVNGGRSDGLLLFAPLPDDPMLPLLRGSSLPVVLINSRDVNGVLPSIKDDVRSGMEMIAEILLREGHKQVAALHVTETISRDADERIDYLRRALQKHGGDIRHSDIRDASNGLKETINGLMNQEDRPTAIFCWHDRLAYQAVNLCAEMGIRVPEDVSIVGYDGMQWPTQTGHTVTSIEVNLRELTTGAVQLLDEVIKNPQVSDIDRLLPVRLFPGTTVGPAPKRNGAINE